MNTTHQTTAAEDAEIALLHMKLFKYIKTHNAPTQTERTQAHSERCLKF